MMYRKLLFKFNLILLLALCLFSAIPLYAQRANSSPIDTGSKKRTSLPYLADTRPHGLLLANKRADTVANKAPAEAALPVERRAASGRSWLLPDQLSLQFAGSIGLVSAGAGFRNRFNTVETDFLVGYLPRSIGGDRLYTTAIKSNWIPFVLFPKRRVQVYPLHTGLMVAYTFGDQFFGLQPDNYPKGYYTFSTAFHAYWQFGSRISMPVKNKRLEFYYELNANAEEIYTMFQNPDFITPDKIFSLSLGLKLNLEPH